MNPREPALNALMATVFSLVVCQVLVQIGGHSVHLTSAQAMSGLAICLAGVAVGLLFVICSSVWQESRSGLGRSLGALGLALGCALLLALLLGHRPLRSSATLQSAHEHAGATKVAVVLARGGWR